MNQTLSPTTQPRIIQIDYGEFYVESSDGKFMYRVTVNGSTSCTCHDFTQHSQENPGYRCEHILAVLTTDAEHIVTAESFSNRKLKLDERFITTINGKEFALYAGLLDLGHQKGIRKIQVDAVQFPAEENHFTAVCKCTLESNHGETYVEWGDASPDNVNHKIAKHIIRMAATRAKARALRDFTNVGMTALEELGDFDDVEPGHAPPAKPPQSRSHEQTKTHTPTLSRSLGTISEAQMRALHNLARRKGITSDTLDSMALEAYNAHVEQLSATDAGAFIRQLQTAS